MASTPTPALPATGSPSRRELRIYMHSPLLYWWPVWAVGFLMAAWTALDNYHMALVPSSAVVEGNSLTVPEGTSPLLTHVHVTPSRIPGAVFVLTILAVLTFGSGWVRGWRAYTFAVAVLAAVLLVSLLHGWDELARWASVFQVHINLGGYLLLSTGLFVLWLVQFFVVDRRRYVEFSFSQVRIHNEIGEEEKVYDTGGIIFEKEQYDWFRRLVGFGAGDLRMRIGGQWQEASNVLHVGRQIDAIETLLRTRDVE
jgi:hypothetical protein